MNDPYAALSKALITKALADMPSGSASRLRRANEQLRREVEALVADKHDPADLTELQQRAQRAAETVGEHWKALVEALELDEDDPKAQAFGTVIGSLLGHILALEKRVAALEMTLNS